jgi:hypothetical protein
VAVTGVEKVPTASEIGLELSNVPGGNAASDRDGLAFVDAVASKVKAKSATARPTRTATEGRVTSRSCRNQLFGWSRTVDSRLSPCRQPRSIDELDRLNRILG